MRFAFHCLLIAAPSLVAAADWLAVGGDRGGMRYSELKQIHRGNVAQLEPAWTYHTGERPQRIIEATPIVVNGRLYASTAHRKIVCLDAATGTERWVFDPMALGPHAGPLSSGGVNRGVAYWTDGKAERILHGTSDGRLFSVDASTGRPDPHFGRGGVVALRDDIEYDISKKAYGPTSAPAIWSNLVVLGFSNSEGPPPGAPGDIRAFDVRSGKQVWRFHTIPRTGEFGADTWPPGAGTRRNGANAWGGVSVDVTRGLVFAGTGSAGADFYGADRHGKNLFANCTLCLDARTGRRRWHFQTVHHDLWDHDLPVYPNLVTVRHGGRQIDAAAQVTKTGQVFLFDRETGTPLFEVNEEPRPASTLPGEQAWPTQPVPTKPPAFAKTSFEEADLSDIDPQTHQELLARFRTLRSGPTQHPPSEQGTITTPGFHGGATWSGASFDPERGLLFVNANNLPNVITMVKRGNHYAPTGYIQFVDRRGYPAIKPPWGTLNAIDLNRGEIRWQVRLGHHPELTNEGVPQTGTESFGGTICTAGDLVFIGGSMDAMFRAFDAETGTVLWERQLPAGGYATPCTFAVGDRQFVCIAASGGGKLRTKTGDALVAFALPNTK